MGRYPYARELTVPHYDCDPLLRLRPSAALRYMQEAATTHLDRLGLSYERLQREGILFVLAAQAVRFVRVPRPGERLTVATCPVMGRGAHMLRETVLLSESGEVLVEGQSSWAMINPESQRLMRASEFRHELPLLEDWRPFCDPSRLRIGVGGDPLGDREVRLADLDRNRHMNNTVYADLMLDCFAPQYLAGGGVDELFIRYRAQARLGQTLRQEGGFDGRLYSVCARLGDKICFESAFSLKTS